MQVSIPELFEHNARIIENNSRIIEHKMGIKKAVLYSLTNSYLYPCQCLVVRFPYITCQQAIHSRIYKKRTLWRGRVIQETIPLLVVC